MHVSYSLTSAGRTRSSQYTTAHGKKDMTIRKLTITITPTKHPNTRTAGIADAAFAKKAADVVADVTSIVPAARRHAYEMRCVVSHDPGAVKPAS